MSDKPPSKTVFIGNIPYGLSEEQITQLFSSAGQVLNFRLVVDPETGRPKGYGFAEFADVDAAASAVRNLNSHQVMGRQLRVDFSHKDNTSGGGNTGGGGGGVPGAMGDMMGMSMGGQAGVGGAAAGGGGGMPGQGPPINVSAVPPGVALPPGVSCPDAISQTLMRIPPAQLLDILSQFKGVVSNSPDSATELLRQQPQLAYAIFQCLLSMGLVDASILKQVIDGAASGATGAAGAGGAPAAAATPPTNPAQAFQPPPVSQTPIQAAPTPQPLQQQQQQQQQQQPAAPPNLPPEQLQAIRSILSITPEQYNALQPMEKSQIDMLRSQYGALLR